MMENCIQYRSLRIGMNILREARNVYNNNGVSALFIRGVGFIYNRTIWSLIPETEDYQEFNNVKRRRRRKFDKYVPFPTRSSSNSPEYEDNLGESIRSYINTGETVLEVATGVGITAVIAARCVGDEGKIITYEGSKSRVKEAENVVELNDVIDKVEINQGIVESDSSRLSDGNSADNIIPVSELPSADVFIIDCDGCEFGILNNSGKLPKKIIVEHHAVLDIQPEIEYQPDRIRDRLYDLGYDILSETETEMNESLPQFGNAETVFVAQK
jgi:hypothetical protein